MAQPLTVQVQTWAETLRLPILTVPAEYASVLTETESLRRPAIPLQSKHLPTLKRNLCFTMLRPADRSRSGLLYVWPAQKCCLFLSPDTRPKIALLRLRLDPAFYSVGSGPTVFLATLSAASRQLQLEDVFWWKGSDCFGTMSFSERWRMVAQWHGHFCVADEALLGGVKLVLAKWGSLANMRNEEGAAWYIQPDVAGARRLLHIIPTNKPAPSGPLFKSETVQNKKHTVSPPLPLFQQPLTSVVPRAAIAVRGTGPDQWTLTSAEGISLGKAVIRKLDVSAVLREATGASARVEIAWNEKFKKWEITGKC